MFLELEGMPYQNGKKIGLHSKHVLAYRAKKVSEIRRIKKISSKILKARVKDFTLLLSRTTPHWLEEIKGQADASGISVDELILLNCLPDGFYSGLPPGYSADMSDNCTSFVSVDKKQSLLFKIRDEKNFPQAFFILGNKGFFRSQAGRDIGNMGFAHFFNEKALAGANNTGSYTKHPTDKPLFNDSHTMRYIAERAGSLKEIPCLIENLLDKGVLGGANGERGAIFLFANFEGGLLIECDSQNYTRRFISKGRRVVSNHYTTLRAKQWESKPPGQNTLLRRKRLIYLLSKNGLHISPESVFAFSRDRKNAPDSLCKNDPANFWTTVSAQYQVINKKSPSDSVNYVCCGNPCRSFYMVFPLEHRHTFLPMLNGVFYKEF